MKLGVQGNFKTEKFSVASLYEKQKIEKKKKFNIKKNLRKNFKNKKKLLGLVQKKNNTCYQVIISKIKMQTIDPECWYLSFQTLRIIKCIF